MLVLLQTVVYPYTLIAITPETGETCTEKGELTVNEASEAQLTGGDYTNAEKTELCEIVA